MASRPINTVKARDALIPRRDPYWQLLQRGGYVGFRKMTRDGGAWLARWRDPESGQQHYRSLGAFDHLPAAGRYDAAKKEAEAWLSHVGKGGAVEIITVADACRRYASRAAAAGGHARAADLEGRFARNVYGDPLGAVKLDKLAVHHLEDWRQRLRQRPVGERERSAATINRDLTALRAALNAALSAGLVGSDRPWRESLKSTAAAGGRRSLYLDREQRRALIDAAPADLAALLRGLALLPLRPGALAALTVANFDRRTGVLTVRKDKSRHDKGEHERYLPLPSATAAFIAEQCRGKLPAAPIFARADGSAWNKDAWKWPLKAAAQAAGLPAETVAYSLRHATITDLVTDGLDLHAVAKLAGTSIVMIEKHYGHLRGEHAAAALAKLAL
jgi:integrase